MLSLAIIPSIVLLVYIYKKDKIEKESAKLLIKCFIWGIIIILPVMVIEIFLGAIIDELCMEGSIVYAALDGFIVAAFSEELFKYLALKLKTWKTKEFNCSFDGIVYAVFVSLGFATFENILYVFQGDLTTAIMRMFTAVPGHAFDAVFMGYFYSKAKKAEIDGNKALVKINKRRALVIPILMHGLYDCLISFDEEVVGEDLVLIGILLWIVYVAAQFVISLKLVNKASKADAFFTVPVEMNDESTANETSESYITL